MLLSDLTPEILQFETLKVNEDADKNYTLPDVWLGHSLDRDSNKWRQKSTGNIIEWKGWLDSCMIDKGIDLILFKLRVYVKLEIELGGSGSSQTLPQN